MKKYKDKVLATVVLIATFCFMLFVYEPIVMYVSNMDDFWFDLPSMMPSVMMMLGLLITGMSILLFGLFFIFRKKIILYDYILVTMFFVFFYCYIQGNFLAGFLPVLDGSPIDWNAVVPNIISIGLFVLFIVIFIVLARKKLLQKSIKIFSYVTMAIFAMLVISLVPMLSNKKSVEREVLLYPSTNNINHISSDKNFMILIVDAVDSRVFNERLNLDEKNKDMLRDFTYYPDVLSAYPFTRESMPMLLTGEWYESQEDFDDFSTKAYNNSKFLNRLHDENYEINIYSDSIVWKGEKDIQLDNWLSSSKINPKSFIKQELKYILFKYLPYPLKRFSKIEGFDVGVGVITNDSNDAFVADNLVFYRNLTDNMQLEKQDSKYFSFIHIDGGHFPFDMDGDLNPIENGNYNDKIDATIKIIAKYLERLKNNNAYNNSVIIVAADHGYNVTNATTGRENPILYIKGFNEHHDKMKVSERPVSEEEYVDAYLRLLDGENGEGAFGRSGYPDKRRYLFYLHTDVDHLIEHEQHGKAWDLTTMKPTGVEYNR